MGLYLRHPSSFEHDTGAHPENANRLRTVEAALGDRDWLDLEPVEAPRAEREQLLRVHAEAHVDRIEELCKGGGGLIDMDTIASAGSWEAALHAAGGAIEAVDRLLGDGAGFAFCGLRPPGHHAEPARAMGFCLFNNAAVAAAHALAAHGLERVLILDWDVHHGNGTEAIFWERSSVLYASIHQSPLYPGTGQAGDVGAGEGEGYTLNMPVPPGAGPEEFLSLVQQVVVPVAQEHEPQLIAISAGYDAHRDDPLADCMLDEGAYGDMAASIRDVAVALGAPVIACLEGGYAPAALAASIVATIEALAGSASPRQASPETARSYRDGLSRFWPALAG